MALTNKELQDILDNLTPEEQKLAIDFEEVTVSRRVYRSGESEYLINGSPCRLKDVTELFYDTGKIGRASCRERV